ncbi:MAG TPA: transcription antitermination factor NusB [Thermoanaerobaculia bacterium]|nr:transcription antitermination factor NusB [Thermoanaerobaculia bacterium]
MNEREQAFLALRRIERDRARADLTLDRVPEQQRPFVRTVVRGVLRTRPALDVMIEKLAKRPLSEIDVEVATLLRTAIYQLLEMDAPPFAVVSETMAIASRRVGRARGFVNAVLRGATRTDLKALLPQDQSVTSAAVRTGHPEWLLRRWIDQFGEERALRIAAADQEPSYPDLLVNTRRWSLREATAAIAERGGVARASPLGIPVLRLGGGTSSLADLIAAGLIYPMDEGSVVVAELVRPGSTVLDLAAAPGGKSLALALGGSRVVSHDRSIGRLAGIRKIWSAWFDEKPRLVIGDGRAPSFRRQFETVLLDAPCSATGTLRKNPEVRWRLSADELSGYARVQIELLRAAGAMAEKEVLYSTCSLESEENERVIEEFLFEAPEFEIFDLSDRVPEPLRGAVGNGVLYLTPEMGTDGFTATGLRRRERAS